MDITILSAYSFFFQINLGIYIFVVVVGAFFPLNRRYLSTLVSFVSGILLNLSLSQLFDLKFKIIFTHMILLKNFRS